MGILVPFPPGTADGQARTLPVSVPRRLSSVLSVVERLLDWAAVVCGVLIPVEIYRLRHPLTAFSATAVVEVAALFGLVVVLLLEKHGEYRPYLSLLAVRETERLLRVGAECLLVILPAILLVAPSLSVRLVIACFLSVPLAIAIEKSGLWVAIAMLRRAGHNNHNAVILGGGPLAKNIYSALLRSPKLGIRPVAIVDEDAALNGKQIHASSYGKGESALVLTGPLSVRLFENMGASSLIIADPDLDNAEMAEITTRAAMLGISTYIVSRDYLEPGYWLEYSEIDGMMLATVTSETERRTSQFGKRAIDLTLAMLALVLLALPCAVVALLIRLTSPGPAIFRQLRAGHRGQLFFLYKFRSMHADSEAYAFSPRSGLDSRITPIGRWLRRTCFDEVPQLWNVVRGEMSLVGPRPEMPFIVDQYSGFQRKRLEVKPGITGLWQLSGARGCLIHENLEYDLYYLRYGNLFMDLAVLLHTIVFAARGI